MTLSTIHNDRWDYGGPGTSEPTPSMPGTPIVSARSRFSPVTIIDPGGKQPFTNLAIRPFSRAEFYPLPGFAKGKALCCIRLHQLDGRVFDFVGTRESMAAFGRWLAAEAGAPK